MLWWTRGEVKQFPHLALGQSSAASDLVDDPQLLVFLCALSGSDWSTTALVSQTLGRACHQYRRSLYFHLLLLDLSRGKNPVTSLTSISSLI